MSFQSSFPRPQRTWRTNKRHTMQELTPWNYPPKSITSAFPLPILLPKAEKKRRESSQASSFVQKYTDISRTESDFKQYGKAPNIGKSIPPGYIKKWGSRIQCWPSCPVRWRAAVLLKEDEGKRNRHRSHSVQLLFFCIEKEKATPKMRGTLAKTYSIKTDNRQPVGSGNPQTPFRVKMRIIYSAVVKRPKKNIYPTNHTTA